MLLSRGFSAFLICLTLVAGDAQAQSSGSSLANRIDQLKSSHAAKSGNTVTAVEVSSPAYKAMLQSVVLIECGSDDDVTYGTGWVVDAQQRLIVTNHHVVEMYLGCSIYFPEYDNGRLVTDPDESITPERAHFARVVDVAADYDLALLQLGEELPEGLQALELAEQTAAPGETIHSVAGSTVGSQSLWVYSTGHVRQTVRGFMANDYEATLLESDMATNQGNSGGPVVNDRGQVVAVVEGHRTDARLVSIYIGLESLVEYLSDALRCVHPETVEDLVFAANRQLDDGRPNPALELVNQALEIEPESAELVALRGWCWYYNSDPETARADFSEAIELDRKLADAHSGLGYLCLDEDDLEGAIKHFTNAIRNAPHSAEYLVARGMAREALKNFENAHRDFDNAVRKDSEAYEAIKRRGYCSIEMRNMDEGLEDLEQVVDLFAEDPEIFFYYGKAFVRKENYDTALKFFSHSSELDPSYARAQLGLGITYMRMEELEVAGEHLAQAYELDSSDPEINFIFGMQRLQVGDDSGLALVAHAVDLDPSNEDFNAVYQQISAEQEADSSSQKLVSASAVPQAYVGLWVTKLSRNGRNVEFRLDIRPDSTYSLSSSIDPNSSNRQDFSEEGTIEVVRDQLVLQGEGPQQSIPFKWQGNQLLIYFEDFNAWFIFTKN